MSGAPPHIAGDDPPSSLAVFMKELAPRPGRLAASLRITVCALIVIVASETFQVSDAALNAYFTYILFKPDANAAVRLTVVAALAILTGIFTTIVFFAATLSEPALRIPLMAVVTFGAMFFSRASTLGPIAMVAGLFMVNSLTKGDNLSQNGSSPYYATNTGHGAPSSLFISSEEALVHSLLWEALGIMIAVAVVVIVNKITAPDPEKSFRAALADRIAAAAAFCAGEDGARRRLADFAKVGTATLTAQGALAASVNRAPHLVAAGNAVIATTSRLALTLLAFERLPRGERDEDALAVWARLLSDCEAKIRHGGTAPLSAAGASAVRADSATAAPLLAQVEDCVIALRGALSVKGVPTSAKRSGLFKPDAFTDPGYARFALKTTLALMACYIFMNLTDWSQIDTCMTTCFVVSLDTVGQSFQKMVTRVGGAAIGAAIGFLAILYVMPALTDVGQLLLLLAPVLFACAWVRTGGERTNYIGQQMAFAFMLMVLQKYGPTLDYDTGRDRVVGILVGEVAVTAVFTQIWPVRVADAARRRIGDALSALGITLGAKQLARADGVAAVQAFGEKIGTARGMLIDDPYEPDDLIARRSGARIDGDVLTALQSASIPLEIVTDSASTVEPRDEVLAAHRRALAVWLGEAAAWVGRGREARSLSQTLPFPPCLDASTEATDRDVLAARQWYAILDRELREVLHKAHVDGAGQTDALAV